jgi:SET domain-containing protein 6
MATLIMAYGFDIDKSPDNADADDESEEEDVLVSDDEEDQDQVTSKGMVPLADLLNASAANNNVCSFASPQTLFSF